MGKIIKFLYRDELVKMADTKNHYLLGFYRVNDDTVLYCSIAKDDNGFEYWYDCNRSFYCSQCSDNSYLTYEECYDELINEIGKITSTPPCIGSNINRTTIANMVVWKEICKIEEPYPVGGMVLNKF